MEEEETSLEQGNSQAEEKKVIKLLFFLFHFKVLTTTLSLDFRRIIAVFLA